jgi:hypothetical protein
MKTSKDEIRIANKLSANYPIDTLITFQKRFVTNEDKQKSIERKLIM